MPKREVAMSQQETAAGRILKAVRRALRVRASLGSCCLGAATDKAKSRSAPTLSPHCGDGRIGLVFSWASCSIRFKASN